MRNLTNPQIINFLACPACKSDLAETGSQLICTACNKNYEIKNGIPLLYPPNFDFEHLHAEENLAEMMKRKRVTEKEKFDKHQWDNSKKEFWGMVNNNIELPPKSFINIGCGYDSNFNQFEQGGYRFINFDIVFDMLHHIQEDYGGKSCVAGDINNLPFKNESIDYLVCIDVIHHECDKIYSILKEFRNLLKPGGMLFLEDPNAWGLFQMAKSILLPRPIYKSLRTTYHRIRRYRHKPAPDGHPKSPTPLD